MSKSEIGTPQIDMNVLLANMVDRRRQGLYDRVRLKAGEMMPASLMRFCIPVGGFDPLVGRVKTFADTNMMASRQLNAPFDMIVSRILFLFQPTCNPVDRDAILARYAFEFSIIVKVFVRQPTAAGAAEGDIEKAFDNFGRGSQLDENSRPEDAPFFAINRICDEAGWNLGKLGSKYIPPLVPFDVTLQGEAFPLQSDLDFYIILDGLMDFPVQ